ncbi:FAD-dependent oxidoreductase [Massilia sp. KIM]|uniref:NAD(P)/FAD-dependent oxidoreductase n=1 Tax=Massilia sp. KIM TaxID=1955422 RepID=UPI00098EEE02|nr:FAD-dependent oxidoreductase [Massilia sp. KIM]OON59303.1 FAD-dependent oxidoreductase [Massilia sp. KIM]
MNQNIVIAGSGFAGLWAALAAARAAFVAGKSDEVAITVVSPEAALHMRPRLYEASLEGMAPELGPLFTAVGVRHLAGRIERIHAADRSVEVLRNDGSREHLAYDRFILATGSQVLNPPLPGLKEYSFNVDQLHEADRLNRHLAGLASQPESAARNTVVVVGGGFTGIETATEMPERLRAILGHDAKLRVVMLEQAEVVGPELGPVPRPVIEEALAETGVEVITSAALAAIDAEGVVTADGRRIPAATVIWTAGMRANPLAAQIGAEHDRFGRVVADPYLRSPVEGVYVTGDVARAAADDIGNVAAMSCQHALSLGRVAGYNAVAELVGLPLHPYSQPKYVTCLDLGPWGALYTEGWDRQVKLTREEGKALKRAINTQWIYPPAPDREAAFALAKPDHVIVP